MEESSNRDLEPRSTKRKKNRKKDDKVKKKKSKSPLLFKSSKPNKSLTNKNGRCSIIVLNFTPTTLNATK